MAKYRSACDSLRPGQLDRLVAKISDKSPEILKEPPTPRLPAAKTTVPPTGRFDAPYILVGEAPGKVEIRERRPFVGPAGMELTKDLNSAFISRPLCYLTNVIKELDRPIESYIQLYKNKRLLKDPIISSLGQQYIDFLRWELEQTSAPVFGAIGAISMYVLTGKIGINKWRGSILDCTLVTGRKVVPILHPATVIAPKYNYLNRRLIIFDLKRLNEVSTGIHVQTERELIINPTFIQTMEFLELCLQEGLKGNRIGYDIEVYMKRVHKQISCISFAIGLRSICIPFTDAHGDYFLLTQEAEIWKKIAEILEHPKIRIVAQNITFDSHFLLRTYGICVINLDDTMIAQNIILPDYPKGLHFITSLFTDHPYYKDDGKNFIGTSSENYKHYWIYNATDSIICTEAMPKQMNELERLKNISIYNNQVKIIGPLVYMMERGIRINVQAMTELCSDYEQRINEAQLELNKLAGEPLNAKSPKQLNAYFVGKKNIKPYMKKGSVTYDDIAMSRLARRGFKEAVLIQTIRRFTKLRSTYLDVTKIDDDGRWRCSFNPAGTRFSRLSSSTNIWGTGGNTQNIPHDLQELMLPDIGYVYYAFDLEQAENRIVAYVGEIIEMIECFEKNIDVHARTGRMIMNISYNGKIPEDVNVRDLCPFGDGTHTWRDWGKKCVVGETEVLTPAGWIKIEDWDYKHLPIAQWEHNRNIKFIMASNLYIGPGLDLIELEGKNIHVIGTTNHRIPIWRTDKNIKTETTLKDIKSDAHYGIPVSGYLNNNKTILNHFEVMLLVAFQADGSFINDNNRIRFRLKKERKIKRLKAILQQLDINPKMSMLSDGITNFYFPNISWLTKSFGSYLLLLGKHEMNTFIQELPEWDGYETENKKQYFTTNKNNAEWVQTIAHLTGYLGTLIRRVTDETRKTLYIVGLNNRTQNATLVSQTKKNRKIPCLVYGPKVPSGFFLIRSKGKISVTGNSNHGFNYDWGYKAFALKNEMTEKDGKLAYDGYHKLYPGVQQNFHAYVRQCLRTSRSLTNLMGRKTLFMDALKGPQADITFKEAYSCIPQGTVGDVINKRGLNYIYYNQDLFKPIELLRQVHDEIGFQIPLNIPWSEHAKMLLAIKASLETPLKTHNGRIFSIPAGLVIGKSLNKATGTEIDDITAEALEKAWEVLNEKAHV